MKSLNRAQFRIQEKSDQALAETIQELSEQLPVFDHDSELQKAYDEKVTQLERTQRALHFCVQAIRSGKIDDKVKQQVERFKGLL